MGPVISVFNTFTLTPLIQSEMCYFLVAKEMSDLLTFFFFISCALAEVLREACSQSVTEAVNRERGG